MSRIVAGVTTPALARLLGPEALGLYTLALSMTQSGQQLSSLGADVAIHRNGARYQTLGQAATGRLFGVGLVITCCAGLFVGLGLVLLRDVVATYWLGRPEVAPYVAAAGVVVLLQPFSSVPIAFLASLQDFRAFAIRSSLSTIVTSVLVIPLAWQFGVVGAISSLILATTAQIAVTWYLARTVMRHLGIRLRFDGFRAESRSILVFGFPYYFGNVLVPTLLSTPLLAFVAQQGGMQNVGYLRVAMSFASIIGIVPTALAPATISVLSACATDDDDAFHRLRSLNLRGVWTSLLLPTAVVALILPSLVVPIFGTAYADSINLVELSLWTSVVAGVSTVFVQVLVADGHTRRVAVVSSVGMGIFALTAVVLVPQLHALGYLLAQMTAQLLTLPFVVTKALRGMARNDTVRLMLLLLLTSILSFGSFVIPMRVTNIAAILLATAAATGGATVVIYLGVLHANERRALRGLVAVLAERHSTWSRGLGL